MVNDNVKVQTGMRVDKLVFDRFKELCTVERLMVARQFNTYWRRVLRRNLSLRF